MLVKNPYGNMKTNDNLDCLSDSFSDNDSSGDDIILIDKTKKQVEEAQKNQQLQEQKVQEK